MIFQLHKLYQAYGGLEFDQHIDIAFDFIFSANRGTKQTEALDGVGFSQEWQLSFKCCFKDCQAGPFYCSHGIIITLGSDDRA